jgi:hypothetical protein
MISRQPIGGMKLREILLSILLSVTHVRESKPSINDLLGCCNPCKYPSRSGKRLLRILPWNCLRLSLDNNSLWVIVDRLVKVAHFVPINTTYTGPQLVGLYSSRIAYFHGVPMRIVFDRETQVISKFWERLHETMATHWNLRSAYYPQTDGQTKQVNQIPDNMLRVYAPQYERSWDKSLPYAEFSYNNSYQESLKMAPFEMLYGRRCQTPLF